MKTGGNTSNAFGDSAERRGDDLLLGRLGSELALIYHDTLQAALPPRLQAIIDRLEKALLDQRSDEGGHRETAARRPGRPHRA